MMPKQARPTQADPTSGDAFARRLNAACKDAGHPARVDSIMLNVGLRCDSACAHCHQSCSPSRTESMPHDTMLAALELADILSPSIIDVTGGEPELYPHLRELIVRASRAGLRVRIRTNLVALARADSRDLPQLFADHGVAVLGSLPGVSAGQIAEQRGAAGWDTALAVLRGLDALGYGNGNGLVLDVAYNPPLGELVRAQSELEAEFRETLEPLGVRFDSLLAIANVPAGRYRERLLARGEYGAYVQRLADAFNPAVAEKLACRHGIEIAWDGTLWDCDFNLGAGVAPTAGPKTLAEAIADPISLSERRIGFGPHCFACTAGSGSG